MLSTACKPTPQLLSVTSMGTGYIRTKEPEKRIFDSSDLPAFRKSKAFERLHFVILSLVDAVKGKDVPEGFLKPLDPKGSSSETNSQSQPPIHGKHTELKLSQITKNILAILTRLDQLIDETPPITGPRRFGNMACRDWHSKSEVFIASILNDQNLSEDDRIELCFYLRESFGSKVRLDYGSGHELNFVAFLGGLLTQGNHFGAIDGDEILVIFATYYNLVRRLILDYSLEPAGSHGVWGLDDHFHFIYILGAAQFNVPDGKRADGYRFVPPVLQVLNDQTIEMCKYSNLYVNAIAFIFRIKQGPFNEHSPILFDIHRSVSLWTKVLSGLQKMYEVEVFGKFPVVQHFYFGRNLYAWVDAVTNQPLATAIAARTDSESESSQETLPGMLNGTQGLKTTSQNISLTGAPWAMKRQIPGTDSRSVRLPALLARKRPERGD
ncbi:hypothetical protein PUMCH_004521 [Australozyma saopauloensis]|uniref:Serine/threonine-protein phosphatase 2A activator n=1 Tax=Australozyma saopauloensis TaxID=291208 RepID=A0AAX4HF32_9ASCO|nr:hypothetical protein PUMCH_004521 [[Candida] saopauloensis]